MDALIFGFGLVVTLLVGTGLALGIAANNRSEPESLAGQPVPARAKITKLGS